MSNKREIQHESALLNEIKALLDGGKTTFHSVARYETPPGVYDNNDLVTYGFVVNLLGSGGAKKISLPSTDYPGVIISDDGFTVTVILDSSLQTLLGTFEPDARLIINSRQSNTMPSFTYGVDGVVTSFIFDGALDSTGGTYKINFVA